MNALQWVAVATLVEIVEHGIHWLLACITDGVLPVGDGGTSPRRGPALVVHETRLFVKRYLTKAARATEAMVRGSQRRVTPKSILDARSPRCGAVSKYTSSSEKSYCGCLPPAQPRLGQSDVNECAV